MHDADTVAAPAAPPADGAGALAGREARGFAAERRLRRPREFAAVQGAPRRQAWRGTEGWLAMTAAWTGEARPGARLGLTLSRRMARRAVDRALVKRIVRESFRHSPALAAAAVAVGQRIDCSVRLARPLQAPGHATRPPLTTLKRALRADADRLFALAAERLQRLPAAANAQPAAHG